MPGEGESDHEERRSGRMERVQLLMVAKSDLYGRRDFLSSEVWQFAGMLGFFVVALVLWLRIVYLPGRTLERWEDQRVRVREEPHCSKESSTRE